MPRNEIVFITDDVIGSMLSNKDFVEAFSFVKKAAEELRSLKGCGRCQSKLAGQRANVLNTLKQSVRHMSGPDLIKLKQLFDTKKIRFRSKDANGKLVEWTM